MFLTNIVDITGATQTWFTNEWPNFCDGSWTLPVPLISGKLDPLLANGTTTIGDCRVACGTARLIEVSGLSSLLIQNPDVVFKTCTQQWEAHIHFPLTSNSLSAKLTSYGMDASSSRQNIDANLNVSNISGTLILIVPMSKISNTSYFFDFTKTLVQINLALSFDKVGNSYIDAALDVEATKFVKALRETLKQIQFTPSFKSTLGPLVLTKRTMNISIDPWVPQGCTLEGPCHPCDTCCLCMSTQICTDQCAKCECLTCKSNPTSWKIFFFVAVAVLLFAVILKQI